MTSTRPSLSQRLSWILGTLRDVLAAGIGREPARVALLLRAWPYLHRLEARFASLVARLARGHSVIVKPRPAATTPRERKPHQSLPRRFGWMAQLAPGGWSSSSQLRHWLADPELAALLAAAPQAGRILRPLCRMLGIAASPDVPPALLTVRPRPPRHAAAPTALPEAPVSDTRVRNAAAPSARASPYPMPA